MKLEDVLNECSKRMDLESLKLDDQGICRFSVDEMTKVSFERSLDEDTFYVYIPIGELPERLNEKCIIQQKILEGNLFGRGTGEASIGYDSSSNLLIIFQSFHEPSLGTEKFFSQFGLLLGFLKFWRDTLEEVNVETIKGVHRLDDPEIGVSRQKNMQIIMI